MRLTIGGGSHTLPAHVVGKVNCPNDCQRLTVQGRPPQYQQQLRHRRPGLRGRLRLDYPQQFVDLVGRLRYTEASLYTQRDTPMFMCAKAPIDAILAQLANMD